MKLRGIIEFEIDDEAMAEHDGDKVAPPNEVDEWEFRDLFRAHEQSLLEDDGDLKLEIITE
jgi:hypothetical protein